MFLSRLFSSSFFVFDVYPTSGIRMNLDKPWHHYSSQWVTVDSNHLASGKQTPPPEFAFFQALHITAPLWTPCNSSTDSSLNKSLSFQLLDSSLFSIFKIRCPLLHSRAILPILSAITSRNYFCPKNIVWGFIVFHKHQTGIWILNLFGKLLNLLNCHLC